MSISLAILDGLVILTFFVAWAESSTDKNFRLTPIRLLRAVSIPCLCIYLFHFVAERDWLASVLKSIPRAPDHLLWLIVGPILEAFAVILFFVLFLWSLFGLLIAIAAQFFTWDDFIGKRKS